MLVKPVGVCEPPPHPTQANKTHADNKEIANFFNLLIFSSCKEFIYLSPHRTRKDTHPHPRNVYALSETAEDLLQNRTGAREHLALSATSPSKAADRAESTTVPQEKKVALYKQKNCPKHNETDAKNFFASDKRAMRRAKPFAFVRTARACTNQYFFLLTFFCISVKIIINWNSARVNEESNVITEELAQSDTAMKLFYYRHNTKNANILPLCTIHFYELTIIRSGNLEYIADNKTVALKGGDILFLKENTDRMRKAFRNVDYFSFNFYMDESDEKIDLPQVIENGNTLEISLLLSAFDEIYRLSYNYNDIKQLDLIFKCILRQIVYNLQARNQTSLVGKIKTYIHDHLDTQISLRQIGEEMHFSSVYCSSVFKKETGQSIIDYVLDKKIELAQKLILEAETELKDIPEKIGFSDYNYFSRLFKKRTNYSPSQYKSIFFS